MGRVFGCLMVGVLVLVACSPGEESEGSEVTSQVETTEATIDAATTTEVVEEGLAAVLDGEPPSTTVSADADEQAAADAIHWYFQTFDGCLADTPNCVPADFELMFSDGPLEALQTRFSERKRLGQYSETDLPSEFTVFWARKSATSDDVVGVLHCERNYYVVHNSDGTVASDISPVELLLLRVVRGDDGQWQADEFVIVDEFQPEADGGDECSTYDGSEVTDEFFDEVIV